MRVWWGTLAICWIGATYEIWRSLYGQSWPVAQRQSGAWPLLWTSAALVATLGTLIAFGIVCVLA